MFDRKIRWRKAGLLIVPQTNLWWMQSHAMLPTVDLVSGDVYRVYFSGRDAKNRSHIGWANVDFSGTPKVLEYSVEPVLTLGALGAFDDNGVTPSCIVNDGHEKLLYYIGWNKGATVRMHLFGGLATSINDSASFERFSRAPIIERTHLDPFLNTAPFVVRDGDKWHMYYVSGVEWVHQDLPRYNIKYASSADGRFWVRAGHVAIDFADPSENALARPMVIKEDGVFKMWFSHKGEAYKLGYAESVDAINWARNDDYAGLETSPNGWDSQMVEYAYVLNHRGQHFMLYNGNNYGVDGVGVAIEE